MNKEDLIKVISKQVDLSKGDAKEVIRVIINRMNQALVAGDRIELRGLGSFLVRQGAGRLGRIITTGETVRVPARKRAVFIPGKVIKRLVNS